MHGLSYRANYLRYGFSALITNQFQDNDVIFTANGKTVLEVCVYVCAFGIAMHRGHAHGIPSMPPQAPMYRMTSLWSPVCVCVCACVCVCVCVCVQWLAITGDRWENLGIVAAFAGGFFILVSACMRTCACVCARRACVCV